MSSYPIISIILPAYNAEKYLATAIESILQQSFKDFEFIILNDGSTDNTEKIILSYTDSRIRYIKNEKNLKLIKTLNKGIELANGKYIARMDADDIALPTMLEECYNYLENNPSFSIVAPSIYHMSEDGTKKRKTYFVAYPPDIIPFIIKFDNIITHPGVMVKSDVLKLFKYEDSCEVLHFEDHDCWNRILNHNQYKIKILEERLLLYRISSNSINSLFSSERANRFRSRQQIWINSYFKNKFDRSIITSINNKTTYQKLDFLNKEMDRLFNEEEKRKPFTKLFQYWKTIYFLKIITHKPFSYFLIFLFFATHPNSCSYKAVVNYFYVNILNK